METALEPLPEGEASILLCSGVPVPPAVTPQEALQKAAGHTLAGMFSQLFPGGEAPLSCGHLPLSDLTSGLGAPPHSQGA